MKKEKECCIVGHQPTNLRFGYSENDERCIRLKDSLEEEIKKLIQDGVSHFMCPMNIGAEIYAAEIIERLQDEGASVTITAVLPFETQASDWSENDRDRFFEVIRRCSEETRTSSSYDDACIAKNIDFMINASDYLIAVWNGKPGNIEYAVCKAKQKNIPIIEINPDLV